MSRWTLTGTCQAKIPNPLQSLSNFTVIDFNAIVAIGDGGKAMEDDRSFYERRLQQELARALIEGTEDLRALHRRWAMLYKARLEQLGPIAAVARNGAEPGDAGGSSHSPV